MSWSEVVDASNSWTVSGSAATSFSEQADVSTTFALANVSDYYAVDYAVDFYVDDHAFTDASAASNTWSSA